MRAAARIGTSGMAITLVTETWRAGPELQRQAWQHDLDEWLAAFGPRP